MKRCCTFLILWSVCYLGISAQQHTSDKQFYYYKGEKFYLQIDYSLLTVISEGKFFVDGITKDLPPFRIDNEGKSYTKQNLPSIENSTDTKWGDIFISEMKFDSVLNETEYQNVIRRLLEIDNVIKVLPVYTNGFNKRVGISHNFYVKLFKKEDISVLFDLAKKYSIQVLRQNEYMPLWFTLSCTKKTPFSSVDAANKFYETHLFESADPEWLYRDLQISNDPYFPDQWGLKNTGQHGGTPNIDIHAEEAWTITTGSSNIRAAVFDQGIKMDHPDLINNIYGTGYDAETGTSPSVVRGFHGTPCGGIVGAQQNNSIGISGVAPDSKLMSVSIYLDWGNTPEQLADGFKWAWQNGADIISNSWGGYNPSPIIENAIDSTLTYGRNGKGTIVVFASGNENNTNIRYPGNSNPDILVVGAISPCGERKSPNSCDGESWGSCYGTQLDVVAPGVFIPTTTYTGNYTLTFNGTSSACPHVAGVAALVLSVNPNLTGQQVRDIIESTAQKVGNYTYSTTSGYPHGTWNNEMGYGLVDACNAVQKAQCTVNFTNQTVTANTTVTSCGDINVRNVTVTNGAKLTLDAAGEVNIISDFEVESGSELEIKQ